MTILQFMGDHPILTFLLALLAGEVIIQVFRAVFGWKRSPKKDDTDDELT